MLIISLILVSGTAVACFVFRTRTILGLVAASLAAPFAVAFTGGLLLAPLQIVHILPLAILAAYITAPLSAFVALVAGVPAVALAHRLQTRSVWVYVGFGLLAGLVAWTLAWTLAGNRNLWPDPAIFSAGGLAGSLVYWLIAERGRSKYPEAEF